MKSFFNIQTKLLIILFSVSVIPLLIQGAYAIVFSSRILEEKTIERGRGDIELQLERMKAFFKVVEADIVFLSNNPALVRLINAPDNNVPQDMDARRRNLELDFEALVKTRKRYVQARYLDETGQEVVRVDFDGSLPQVVSPEKLQNKSNRYYFKEAMKLSDGKIYSSPLDLNKERGKIEVPHKPVIRYATPVFDVDDKKKGIVIINVLAESFLAELSQSQGASQEKMFLIDQDGYFLMHPDNSKRWGGPGDLKTGESVHKEYPEDYIHQIFSQNFGHIDMGEKIILYQTVFPNSTNKNIFWVLINELDKDIFLASVIRHRNSFGIMVFLTGLFVLLLGVMFARLFVKPIRDLSEAAEKIGSGDFSQSIKVASSDEIGDLADSFNKMVKDLKEKTTSVDRLNDEVAARKKAREKEKTANQQLRANEQQLKAANQQLLASEQELKAAKTALEQKVIERTKDLEKARASLEVKVQERTKELQDKITQIEKMNQGMTGRELRMVELKERIKELEAKLKEA